jgi:transglutaminase-like putative cysteine protease
MFSKAQLKTKKEYLYLFGVGGFYLYALNRVILSATVIQLSPVSLYIMGMFCLLIFTAVLFNRTTRITAAAIFILVALYIFLRRETYIPLFMHFEDLFLMATGYLPYRLELGWTLMWLICIALSFTTVVFMLYRFSFTVLVAGGVSIFALSWVSSFIRDTMSFMIFLFVFFLIFIRKTNKGFDSFALAAPLCFVVILLVQWNTPSHSEMYTRRTLRAVFENRLAAVEDFFYELFNPTYFTFANTGFSGAGGRLGGPVTPNNRHVMDVTAPGMTHLRGTTRNHFDGSAWTSTLREGDIDTQGFNPDRFEMLETAAALIRDASFARGVNSMNINVFRSQFPRDSVWEFNVENFSAIGLYADEQFDPNEEYLRDLQISILEGMIYDWLTDLQNDHPEESEEQIWEWLLDIVGLYLYENPQINDMLTHSRFEIWLDEWKEANPQYGIAPTQDALGRVRYYLHTYLPMTTLSISSGRNRTGTIFRPPASGTLWFCETGPDYSDRINILPSGDIRTPGFMGRGTVYNHHFLNVNTQLAFVTDILHQSRSGLYRERSENPQNISVQMMNAAFNIFTRPGFVIEQGFIRTRNELNELLDDFAATVLAAYAESVRTHFLHVPETVPRRVHDLTHQIIRREETDFGRVMAIRNFLLANFPYTLDPVPVPRDVCFVDFFLFEGQEGYCTYFASAMAIMSRIAGVPSRYVEGFFVPGAGRHEHTLTAVGNRMAHAWAEVYFEGYGWLVVEATPPYALALNENDLTRLPGLAPGFSGLDWENEYLDFDEMWRLQMLQNQERNGAGYFPGITDTPNEVEVFTFGIYQMIVLLAVVFGLIIAGIVLYFVICRVRFSLTVSRLGNFKQNYQAQVYFKGILTISEYYHLTMVEGETTLSYGKRAGKRFAFRSDAVFLRDLISLYNRAKYGHKQISNGELVLMKECYFDMLKFLRSQRHSLHYLYLRYVKHIGSIKIA